MLRSYHIPIRLPLQLLTRDRLLPHSGLTVRIDLKNTVTGVSGDSGRLSNSPAQLNARASSSSARRPSTSPAVADGCHHRYQEFSGRSEELQYRYGRLSLRWAPGKRGADADTPGKTTPSQTHVRLCCRSTCLLDLHLNFFNFVSWNMIMGCGAVRFESTRSNELK